MTDDKTNVADQYRVPGFKAGAVAAGIRYQGRPDLALIISEVSAAAAGVFTTNKVQAAPVILSRSHLTGNQARAIVVNSGIANACTDRGLICRPLGQAGNHQEHRHHRQDPTCCQYPSDWKTS